jgi:hypothetical protein
MLANHSEVFLIVGVVLDGGPFGVEFEGAGLNRLPSEGSAGSEDAEILEGKDGKKRVLGEADAKGDVEGWFLVEVAQEVFRKDVGGRF